MAHSLVGYIARSNSLLLVPAGQPLSYGRILWHKLNYNLTACHLTSTVQ